MNKVPKDVLVQDQSRQGHRSPKEVFARGSPLRIRALFFVSSIRALTEKKQPASTACASCGNEPLNQWKMQAHDTKQPELSKMLKTSSYALTQWMERTLPPSFAHALRYGGMHRAGHRALLFCASRSPSQLHPRSVFRAKRYRMHAVLLQDSLRLRKPARDAIPPQA